MSLAGRIALVTGGGRGIGRAVALGLAEDGADVAVNYRRDSDSARETVAAIEALGRKARAYRAPVDDFAALRSLVDEASKELGAIDLLVNNAGIASRGQSVCDTDPDELERCIRIHALGPAELCRLVLPGMRAAPRGDIIMISSVATLYYAPNSAPYNMGKAAMEALAFGLAKEERANGIHVNVVAPGLVETEMGRRLVKATRGVDDLRKLDASMPFGRVCQPEDVANVVRYLVSEGGAYLTGEKLNVHAGG
jgi:NAD(P)-dependent dehydrogenase (short-subunit alcohol dehydrogenase family)